MKIYVLTALNKGNTDVLTATTDKNLMDTITAKLNERGCYWYAVTECDSDNVELFAKKIWRVDFDKDNEIVDVYNVSGTARYYFDIDKVNFNTFPHAYIVIEADDILSAIEIAKKKYQEELKKIGE